MADTVGFNIELGLDASELKAGLREIKDDLQADKAQLSELDKQLKIAPDNIDKWKKKQQLLNKQIEDTKKKLKLQTAQLKQAQKQFDGTDEAKAHMKELGAAIKKTNNEIKKMSAQLQTTNDKIKQLSSLNINKLSSMGSALTKYITAPALAAGTAIAGLTLKSANSLDELADTASQVGANVVAYQQLMYVTKLLGADTNSLERAFIKVNAMLGDIATGDSLEAAQTLSKIGLSVDDIKGKDTTEAFLVIREALSKLGDESLQVAYANEIFGDKIGAALLPVLKAENSQIESLTNEANSLGVANEEQIKKAGDFGDSMDRLKQALFGVALMIMDELLPTLTEMATKIKDEVIPKVKGLITWFNELNPTTQKIIEVVALLVVGLGPLIKGITSLISLVSGISKGFSLLTAALGGVSLSTVGLVAGIVALVAGVIYAYNTNEQFRNSVNNLWENIKSLIKVFVEITGELLDSFKPVLDILIELFNTIIDLLAPIMTMLVDLASTTLKTLANDLKILFEIARPFIEIISEVLVAALARLNDRLTKFKNIAGKVIDFLREKLKPLMDFIEKIREFFTTIPNKINEFSSSIKDKLGGSWLGSIGDFFGNIGDNIKGTISSWFGKGSSTDSTQSVTTNNAVNVYTTSATYDVNSINAALGGMYR